MDEIERLNTYIEFYKDCLDRLLKMYPDPKAKEMYELGVKDGADLAWMHGSDATAQELEKAYFQGMDEAMKKRDVQPIVHGKWINVDNSQRLLCSVCSHEQINPNNYCPTCGARMNRE